MRDEQNEALRLYYDETAPEYDDYWTRRGKFFDPASNSVFLAQASELGREVTRFAASLPHNSGTRVLDIACGTGKWTAQIAKTLPEGAQTFALDWSAAMLNEARLRLEEDELLAKVSLIRADAYTLPFPNNSFDGILLGFWLGHVPATSALGFLSEVKRVLKPGGLILALEHAPFPGRPNQELQNRQFKDGRTRQVLKIRFSPTELKELLEKISAPGKANARLTTRELFVMGWAQV